MKRYSHCPVCGAPYGNVVRQPASAPSLLLCPSCGFHFWQNSKPAVAALVTRTVGGRREILLSRRGIEPYKGMWDFPGGYLSNGELPEEGLARELQEELNVPVRRARLFATGIDEYPREDVAEEARFVLSLFFRCEIDPDAALAPADDVAEASWFPLEEPPALAFKSNLQTLRDLARICSEESGGGRASS